MTYDLRRVEPWDGIDPPDYVCPVEPGDRVVLAKGDTVLVSRVVRHEGYAPDVVELEDDVVVDLAVGWYVGVIPKDAAAGQDRPAGAVASPPTA